MQDRLKLNKNYKELYTTIKNLREYAKDNANDKFARLSCYTTYDSLVVILPSKEMIYDNNEMKLEELFNSICEKEINAVYRNRQNYQVTVDTFFFQLFCSTNTLPGRSQFDQNTIVANTSIVVEFDQAFCFRN